MGTNQERGHQSESWGGYWNSYWTANEDATKHSPAQAFRRKLLLQALQVGEGARVLDIGSGQGDFALDLSEVYPGCKIMGLELSESGVAISQKKVPKHIFLVRDLTQPSPPADEHRGWATHAACAEVLEHIADPEGFLKNVRPYLAQGCRLVVTVPGGPMSAFDKHIGHVKHYTPVELRALLREAGFLVERVSSAGFPFFNLYRLMVIARGDRLVQDVASPGHGSVSPLVKVGSAVFGLLFKINPPLHRLGWQIVAVAKAT